MKKDVCTALDYVYKINTCHRQMKILSSLADAVRNDPDLKFRLREVMTEDLDPSECETLGVASTFESISNELGDFVYLMEAVLGSVSAPSLNQAADGMSKHIDFVVGGGHREAAEEKVG